MKIPKIARSVGRIDDDLITAAAAEPARTARRPWVKWGVLAASVGAVVLASVLVIPMFFDGGLPEGLPEDLSGLFGNTVSFGDLERDYKNKNVTSSELSIEWPDEYLTVQEKHSYVIWAFQEYRCSGRTVGQELLGNKLGNYFGFEVYSLVGMPEQQLIAIGMEGDYYVYRGDFTDKPDTFGQLDDLYHLTDILQLDRFSAYEDGSKDRYFALTDDAYILEVLATCRDATVVENSDGWSTAGRDYLSFSVTSDLLGVYRKVLYITEDGYLKTNMFDYAYVYQIGEDAARKIIDYAMANSTEKKTYEPFDYRLAGTLVEIKDGYAYIDDSIMCRDPDDGMVFRVSTEDIRIRRCIEYAGVGVGDVVVVTFRGGIDLENGNLITGAESLDKAYFDDGDVLIPE